MSTEQTNTPMRIVVVGGVAGGASAATRARRMNEHAEIILLEKDGYVSFANCGLPYYLGGEITDREKLLVAKPELLRNRYNIDVRTHHLASKINRDQKSITVKNINTNETYNLAYDKLILSPGARPVVPPMPGIDAKHVYTLRSVEDTDRIKTYLENNLGTIQHVTVVGAGFIGLEMVEQLASLGPKVMLVELQNQVLPLLDRDMAIMLEDEMTAKGIDVQTGIAINEILQDNTGHVNGVVFDSKQIKTDMVLMGIGVTPNHELAEAAELKLGKRGGITANQDRQTNDPNIYAVGDASEYIYGVTGDMMRIPLAGPANRAGRVAGTHASNHKIDLTMPNVLGTSAVRVFGLSAAMTGMSLKNARQAYGQEARCVTVTANDHVGYYPGATPIVLRLVYMQEDGKIIGAQAIGKKGVDKRIDVIATLMHMKGTVRDLAGLDLVYAPPFGAAKDVVHQAAFAASNELDGLIAIIQPNEIDSTHTILDVRTQGERQNASIPGSIHIPLDELRNRIGELDLSNSYAAICGSGLRSYIAARILLQRGFTSVINISGGMTGWLRMQKTTREPINQ
ncbi:FAD-dependent oxidoreductase [Poriferisphaera sp. WC338]|uniref:FAD-dependent oxidoreductase n=1 Tax=Poriferisphaera sp. WC338 TaxID=3425129 RepID=UPI003D818D40